MVYHFKVLSEAAERKEERTEEEKGVFLSIKRHICNVFELVEGHHPSAPSWANQLLLQGILEAGKLKCVFVCERQRHVLLNVYDHTLPLSNDFRKQKEDGEDFTNC